MGRTAPPDQPTTEFVRQLTDAQSRLYAYICTLLGQSAGARDVLQETNLALWAKVGEFDPARPFLPWAIRFAHLQVLAHRKRHVRDRLLFNDDLLNQVAQECAGQLGDLDRQLDALDGCLQRLPAHQRELIARRYAQGESVQALASALGRTPNVVAASLYRIRKVLLDCVQGQLTPEGNV